MRYVYTGILIILALVVLIFSVQNAQTVTVSFLKWSARLPLFVVILSVYLLGMASGSSVSAAVRWTVKGTQRGPESGETS